MVGLVIPLIASAPAAAQCGWAWTIGAPLPSPRSGAAMAYDSGRGCAVLVGGTLADGTVSNATIEFDGAAWQLKSPSGPLPRRTGHAMAYDSTRGVIVLFGGLTGAPQAPSSTTYEFDGTTWRVVPTPASPPARRWHAMTYDPLRQVVVMHGGLAADGLVADTWEYNGVTWTQRSAGCAGARCQHSIAYDPSRQKVILFGGATWLDPVQYGTMTWAWDGTTWTEVPPGASGNPPARSGGAMAWSPAAQRLVLTGGFDSLGPITTTSALTPQGWSTTATTGNPPARRAGCMVWHAGLGRFVVAGGSAASGGLLTEAWLLAPGVAFTSGPGSQQVNEGLSVTLTASVSGAVSGWQWRRDGAPISNDARVSGATSSSLLIDPVTAADQGVYDVVAMTACGPLPSPAAVLTIVPACGTSDYNGDGDIGTDQDIEAFFACLGGTCCDTCHPGGSDFNNDGDAGTDQDIESFFRVLGGNPC